MLNERLSQYHYLYRSSICHYFSSKPRPLSAFCSAPFSCSSKTESRSALLHSVAGRNVSPCACLPSGGAVAGNCLCNLMTPYLYLAEKVVARICPAQFFFFFTVSIFGISQSPKRHIGPDSIWVEGGFLHCTGLFIHWKLRSKKFHGRPLQSKDFMCSTLPPPPNMRAAGIVGALMAFKCCSKKGKQAWKV